MRILANDTAGCSATCLFFVISVFGLTDFRVQ